MEIQKQPVQKIHVVFKTHLDVGFTDFAANVTAAYFEQYIPQALDLAKRSRQEPGAGRFVWTTGSWLIYEYLEWAAGQKRKEMEEAIIAGDIAWHGLPFTTHSECMDEELFRFGLSLSAELDQRFGKQTLAAKMTDVPGHTRGIVPLIAEAGIQFLHLGVNPASTPPQVPPVFVWRHPQGAELVVMLQRGAYGSLNIVPGMQDAIYFAHTNDNLGPQSPGQIDEVFLRLQHKFPQAEICGSTMDAFAREFIKVKNNLPVLTQELGDSWIHGAATDPKKMSQFRELLRLRSGWVKTGRVDPFSREYKAFQRFLLLVPEHTWGLDLKTHLNDFTTYKPADLKAARSRENFIKMERSWQEQREYLQKAVQALPESLAGEARQTLANSAAARPDLSSFEPVIDFSQSFQTPFFALRFDPLHGAICSLKERQTSYDWASPGHPLGQILYETFSQADYDRFYRQYIIQRKENTWWAKQDFTKPGIEFAGAAHQEWRPELKQMFRRAHQEGEEFILCLQPAEPAWQKLGCPRSFILRINFLASEPKIEFDLTWFEKQANRLPEALWFSFLPRVPQAGGWKLVKLGQEVDPNDVALDGNRKLHAVLPGVLYRDETTRLMIETVDAPLVAPGRRSLLDFNNRKVQQKEYGMHFLLYNNLWGTNFPMWYDEDARFRFVFSLSSVSPKEKPQ